MNAFRTSFSYSLAEICQTESNLDDRLFVGKVEVHGERRVAAQATLAIICIERNDRPSAQLAHKTIGRMISVAGASHPLEVGRLDDDGSGELNERVWAICHGTGREC